MAVARREMLKAGALAGASLLVPLPDLNAAQAKLYELPARSYGNKLFSLTRSAFQSYVNSTFTIRLTGRLWRSVDLRLFEVADVSAAQAAGMEGHEECFAVHFVGPTWAPLTQATYQVRHKILGALNLFLVPVGRPRRTSRIYEAIINRQTA